jgi:hypothetical protein
MWRATDATGHRAQGSASRCGPDNASGDEHKQQRHGEHRSCRDHYGSREQHASAEISFLLHSAWLQFAKMTVEDVQILPRLWLFCNVRTAKP